MAVVVFALLPAVVPPRGLDELQYVVLNVAVLAALSVVRGLLLPVKLTAAGVQEVVSMKPEEQEALADRLPFVRDGLESVGGVEEEETQEVKADQAAEQDAEGDY